MPSSLDMSASWPLREEAGAAPSPSTLPSAGGTLRSAASAKRPAAARQPAALAKWRLARALDYVEANLGEPVRLSDMAAAAGLTGMHFAAQFRAAMGVRPREYLLRRRIARAQQLLSASSLPLVDVALEVGFQTQAHFTTVFKRLSGSTPGKWRAATYCGADLLRSPGRGKPGADAASRLAATIEEAVR